MKYCLILIVVFSSLMRTSNSYGDNVLVAVAANFAATARQLKPLFEQNTGHKLIFSVASTGKLYNQIAHGAPFDVLLAADKERPAKAEKLGFAVAGSRFTYAIGRLALCASKSDLIDNGQILKNTEEFNKLALANPAIAPYGEAAVEAMEALEVYPQVKSKLVFGDNVAQAFQFVYTGNADLGMVALSQVIANTKLAFWPIPETLHAPIEQDAVLLLPGENKVAAQLFLQFLKGGDAQEIIVSNGHGLPQSNS